MKERGIIMAGWTTLAILRGDKHQTRRLANARNGTNHPPGVERCPHGVVGDLLWVRETWQAWKQTNVEYDEHEALTREARGGMSWAEWVADNGIPHVEYRATSTSMGPWVPAIHMPRWASRLTLKIDDIRIEKLQDISEEDAHAEGVARDTEPCDHTRLSCEEVGCLGPTYRASFCDAWEGIHGDGSWEANPWVWVISFSRYKPGAG